jgi:hypothetical protein
LRACIEDGKCGDALARRKEFGDLCGQGIVDDDTTH